MYTLTLDFSKRHCWELKDGRYSIDGQFDAYCEDWRNHPLKAGESEFTRWIREFGILAPNITFGDLPGGWITLGVNTMADGTKMYAEDYGGKLLAFLDTVNGKAYVEVRDADLEEFAAAALYMVEGQYLEMAKQNV